MLSKFSLILTCVDCPRIEEGQLYSIPITKEAGTRPPPLAGKPLVSHLRYASEVLLQPGNYQPFQESQGNNITRDHVGSRVAAVRTQVCTSRLPGTY